MRHVLMQAPRKEEDCNSQIVIVDNSKTIGKKRIENLVERGYTCVGTIESEIDVHQLQRGFAHNTQKKVDVMHDLFREISKLADSHIDRTYEAVN